MIAFEIVKEETPWKKRVAFFRAPGVLGSPEMSQIFMLGITLLGALWHREAAMLR